MRKYAGFMGGSALALGLLSVSANNPNQAEAQRGRTYKPIVQTETDGGVSNRYFRYGTSNIPHVSKKDKGGEDAYYASDKLLVVADGVGGWIMQGIDSGLFSKQLVADIGYFFNLNNAWELRHILVECVKVNKNTGSSTAVLAKFDTSRENYLKATNLGDSGYLILRPNADGSLT